MELGSGRKDTHGLNAGLYELASGPEISGYFDRVMNHHLLPSGRVRYHPLSNHLGGGRVESLLSGRQTQFNVRRKTVDARYYSPPVPSTHLPRFSVAAGVDLVPPNALPGLWARSQGPQARPLPKHFVVLGAGKTAMDACIWLLQSGADPGRIQWVVPRDSWLINRVTTQNGPEFFHEAIGGQVRQMTALALASSVEDLFLRLEGCGTLLRIDPTRTPTMFHLATVSEREVAELRRIDQVIRLGRVQALEPGRMVMDQDSVAVSPGTLFIDCTASAVEPRPPAPIFQGHQIVLQMVRLPQPAFSAAITAYVEAHYASDAEKNRLCGSVPFPHTLADYPRSLMVGMWNQAQWGQDKTLRQWVRDSRLDGFGKLMASAPKDDVQKQAVIAAFREQAMLAMANIPRLLG
jgi:hypothetical protein